MLQVTTCGPTTWTFGLGKLQLEQRLDNKEKLTTIPCRCLTASCRAQGVLGEQSRAHRNLKCAYATLKPSKACSAQKTATCTNTPRSRSTALEPTAKAGRIARLARRSEHQSSRPCRYQIRSERTKQGQRTKKESCGLISEHRGRPQCLPPVQQRLLRSEGAHSQHSDTYRVKDCVRCSPTTARQAPPPHTPSPALGHEQLTPNYVVRDEPISGFVRATGKRPNYQQLKVRFLACPARTSCSLD